MKKFKYRIDAIDQSRRRNEYLGQEDASKIYLIAAIFWRRRRKHRLLLLLNNMSKTSSVTSSASSAANEYLSATHKVIQSYQASTITALTILFLLCADTPALHQVIDAYLVAVMLSGILQFVYCILVGTYPYNAFLAGFISSVGSFIFGGTYIHSADLISLIFQPSMCDD